MTFIPNVLLRKLYKKGSLRLIDQELAFDLKNILGPGIITQINFVKINDYLFDAKEITMRFKDKNIKADQITSENPLFIAFNQIGTLILHGNNCLTNGKNKIQIELISQEAGLINVTVFDDVNIEN